MIRITMGHKTYPHYVLVRARRMALKQDQLTEAPCWKYPGASKKKLIARPAKWIHPFAEYMEVRSTNAKREETDG